MPVFDDLKRGDRVAVWLHDPRKRGRSATVSPRFPGLWRRGTVVGVPLDRNTVLVEVDDTGDRYTFFDRVCLRPGPLPPGPLDLPPPAKPA